MRLDWMVPMYSVGVILGGMAIVVWALASFEAAAYKRHCDTPVTTWDAIWLDLRIDECAKCEK